MNPEKQRIIIDSILNHFNLLESSINTVLVLSLAILWAGIQRKQHIEFLGNTFNRRHAFFIVSIFYLLMNLSVLVIFLRLGDLISLLEGEQALLDGITQFSTHRWLLNPYAYFSDKSLTIVQSIYTSTGFGLLTVVWWICNSSLYLLMDDKTNTGANVLLSFFLLIGLCTIGAVYRGFYQVLAKCEEFERVHDLVVESMKYKTMGVVAGAVFGVAVFYAIYRLQENWIQYGSLFKKNNES